MTRYSCACQEWPSPGREWHEIARLPGPGCRWTIPSGPRLQASRLFLQAARNARGAFLSLSHPPASYTDWTGAVVRLECVRHLECAGIVMLYRVTGPCGLAAPGDCWHLEWPD